LAEGALDQRLGARAHAGCRLIQDQDAWVRQGGARNRDQLALALAVAMFA